MDWGAQVVRARQVVAERAPLIQQQLSQVQIGHACDFACADDGSGERSGGLRVLVCL